MDADYIRKHEGQYRSGDYAGKTGIEAAREEDLRGEKGYKIYIRDSRNQIKTAYQNGEIYEHFGHCPYIALYEYGETVSDCRKRLIDTSCFSGHYEMTAKVKELGADAVIAGNMGSEARAELLSAGIVPVVGYSGDADTASDLLATGQLPLSPSDSNCGCGGGCSCGCSDKQSCACGCDEGCER